MRTFIDQYGRAHYAKTVKELRERLGGAVHKMYVGDGVHIGYVIGRLWLTEYVIRERSYK